MRSPRFGRPPRSVGVVVLEFAGQLGEGVEFEVGGAGLGKRRDKPAWRRRWKSSTPKGVAIHGGPESCVDGL
jgi:hypothetical protein